jgi:hypothetical protein
MLKLKDPEGITSLKIPNLRNRELAVFHTMARRAGLTMAGAARQLLDRTVEGEIELIPKKKGG